MPILPSVPSPTAARLKILDAALASDPSLWPLLAPVPDEYYRDADSVSEFVQATVNDGDTNVGTMEARVQQLIDRISSEERAEA